MDYKKDLLKVLSKAAGRTLGEDEKSLILNILNSVVGQANTELEELRERKISSEIAAKIISMIFSQLMNVVIHPRCRYIINSDLNEECGRVLQRIGNELVCTKYPNHRYPA